MLIEQTLDKLNAMKLAAMADTWRQQIQTDEAAALSFDERLGLLVDAEWTAREQRKLERRLRTAKLRYPATLEAVDFTHSRRLNRQQILTLGACAWIAERHNLILVGPTGIGKSFLACAFVERACRRGFAARYVRMPRLLHELAVGRGDGSYTRLLARLAKLDLLAIDDWMLAPLRDPERRDLTEVIEDRAERASTLIASQLPVTDWHCSVPDLFDKPLVATFDREQASSDGGAVLRKAAERVYGLVKAFGRCLIDRRAPGPLRGPLPLTTRPVREAATAPPVVLLHRHFQPRLDPAQQPPVAQAPGDGPHQVRVRDLAEVVRQVGVHHLAVSRVQQPMYASDRVIRVSAGPVRILLRLQVGFAFRASGRRRTARYPLVSASREAA